MHALQNDPVAVMQARTHRDRALVISLDRDRAQLERIAAVTHDPDGRILALVKERCDRQCERLARRGSKHIGPDNILYRCLHLDISHH